ncbi:hypothetical protein BS50DRAFT_360283 [Corynespora cassiicola Philippines]|uniref:Uncharacterized protein n=1 Tax=Corynespora cassiicola Philippines TaxID=1448308 RepID=A0A2T2NT76_CORCC|nr:hypothetical protein BS50DRAFT_360283 [Corynespora cassiicola Philippines]
MIEYIVNILKKTRVLAWTLDCIKLRLTPKEREAAITRFVLSMSDQQLVTGLAILVAVTANQPTISPAEFQIALSLAWFSSTTHLSTLYFLSHYLQSHTVLRGFRVGCIVILTILFIYCFTVAVILQGVSTDRIPVRCYVNRCTQLSSDYLLAWPYISWASVALVLVMEYKNSVLMAYGCGANDIWALGPLSRKLVQLGGMPQMSRDEWSKLQEEVLKEKESFDRRRWLERALYLCTPQVHMSRDGDETRELSNSKLLPLQRLTSHIILYQPRVFQRGNSSFPLGTQSVFLFIYGLTQMIVFQVQLGTSDIEIDRSMGFGQITALILLVLPFLAAAEIYYESKPQAPDGPQEIELHEIITHQVQTEQSSTFNSFLDLGDTQSMDLETANDTYDAHRHVIQRYLYQEDKKLESSSSTTPKTNPIQQYKKDMLIVTKRLLIVERDWKIGKPGIVSFFPTVIAAVIATCMNMGTFSTTMSIISDLIFPILLLFHIIGRLSVYIKNIFHYFESKHTFHRILEELRGQAGSRD